MPTETPCPSHNQANENTLGKVADAIIAFCQEFVCDPYLCYTEHGQHARFYSEIYNAISEHERYTTWLGQRICVVQKEYPTAVKLGRSRRQNWDIAVLRTPPESLVTTPRSYDYLKLLAVIEFAMNEAEDHLVDDLERLGNADANLARGFIVHLHRLSQPGSQFSGRDWSPNSSRILTRERTVALTQNSPVDVYYGMVDTTGTHQTGLWRISRGVVSEIPTLAANGKAVE